MTVHAACYFGKMGQNHINAVTCIVFQRLRDGALIANIRMQRFGTTPVTPRHSCLLGLYVLMLF